MDESPRDRPKPPSGKGVAVLALLVLAVPLSWYAYDKLGDSPSEWTPASATPERTADPRVADIDARKREAEERQRKAEAELAAAQSRVDDAKRKMEEAERKVRQGIMAHCRRTVGDYGASLVKTCVDEDMTRI